MSLDDQVMQNTNDIHELTKNVTMLSTDVSRLVQSQQDMQEIIKNQAVHDNNMVHFRESLGRAFKTLSALEVQVSSLKNQLAVAAAVDETRVSLMSFIFKYWHVLTAIAGLSAFAGSKL